MEYFKRTIKIGRYGWEIKLFEPTLKELTNLEEMYKQEKWDDVAAGITPLISSWDCTNRKGEILPTTTDGVSQLPLTVFTDLFVQLRNVLLVDDGPKNVSD